jgi:integrase
MRRIIMLLRKENVEERTGQYAQALEKDGQKTPLQTLNRKYSRRADIFTDGELERFFNSGLYGDPELYLFYLCCLTERLRLGEGRGLHPKQIIFDRAMLIVDGSINKNGFRTAYTKKGNRDYWKLRIVPLPDLTLSMLKEHIQRKRLKDDGFIFTAKKDITLPVTDHYVRDQMARIIRAAGIQAQGRNLSINSFRHTFINHIRRELPTGIVMKLAGHKLFEIIDHYNKRGIDESSAGFAGADEVAKKVLTKAELGAIEAYPAG